MQRRLRSLPVCLAVYFGACAAPSALCDIAPAATSGWKLWDEGSFEVLLPPSFEIVSRGSIDSYPVLWRDTTSSAMAHVTQDHWSGSADERIARTGAVVCPMLTGSADVAMIYDNDDRVTLELFWSNPWGSDDFEVDLMAGGTGALAQLPTFLAISQSVRLVIPARPAPTDHGWLDNLEIVEIAQDTLGHPN